MLKGLLLKANKEIAKKNESGVCDECREVVLLLKYVGKKDLKFIVDFLKKNKKEVTANMIRVYLKNNPVQEGEIEKIKNILETPQESTEKKPKKGKAKSEGE